MLLVRDDGDFIAASPRRWAGPSLGVHLEPDRVDIVDTFGEILGESIEAGRDELAGSVEREGADDGELLPEPSAEGGRRGLAEERARTCCFLTNVGFVGNAPEKITVAELTPDETCDDW